MDHSCCASSSNRISEGYHPPLLQQIHERKSIDFFDPQYATMGWNHFWIWSMLLIIFSHGITQCIWKISELKYDTMRGINKYSLIIDSNPLQYNGINLPLVSFLDPGKEMVLIIIQETIFRDFNKILVSELFASYFLN